MAEKVRLDQLIADRGLAESREMAKRLIMEGHVSVAGQLMDKPGTRVSVTAAVELRALPRFVSRGGEKLQAALDQFPITVTDAICADVGASTGGFTDCLLQAGAAKIYAIDVGYGQIDYRLRTDPRVVVMERTNARYVEALPEKPGIAVVDASFISLRLLLPVIRGWFADQGTVIVLIKPQFEAGKDQVGKGGVVKNPAVHQSVLREVLGAAQREGYRVAGLLQSPLKGPAGNIEFLGYLQYPAVDDSIDLEAVIAALVPLMESPE
jgi:23S rRNA (cytidine1920-2'-O)/16S rRNA (cytidine1409-2'-O)-methyltransferase